MPLPRALSRPLLGLAALALLGGQAPILPPPVAITPTPMAQPGKPGPAAAKAPARGKAGKGKGARGKPGAGKRQGKAKPQARAAKGTPGFGMKPMPKAEPTQAVPGSPFPSMGGFFSARPSAAPVFPGYTPRPGGPPPPFPTGKPGAKFPGYARPATRPSTRGFGSPPPTPTPAPPRAMGGPWVLVSWGGLGLTGKTIRYGESLKFRPAKGFHQPIYLFVVNPGSHEDPYGARAIGRFPGKLTHQQKIAYLGYEAHYRHVHWLATSGEVFDLTPDFFLNLYEELHGKDAGYLWPMKFLFYVAVVPPGQDREVYYKLVVTVRR